MGRAPCCEKMGLKKGPWTPEEDQILVDYIRLHGHTNWRALPKLAGLLRCGKSCRLRWTNYLKPGIKRGNFTPEEEETIINLHQTIGNRWSTIAAKLPGRTDNEIKNVWHTYLKKRSPKSDPESATVTDGIVVEPGKKRPRKLKAVEKDSTSKKLKSGRMNCMDTKNDNKIEDKICKNDDDDDDDESNVSAKPQSLNGKGPISPQPCTSEMSTVTSTSTSTSTSENDNGGKENVGNKGEYFDDFTEIDDDFWMEVLSVEDTAMSTEDLLCAFQYDPNISLDLSMTEPMLESNFKAHGDDIDGFWYNLLTKSNEVIEISEIL